MSQAEKEYLTTKELAELLRIKERKVYDLASSGTIPCSRALGKLLFPRQAVEAWLQGNGSKPVTQIRTHRPNVFLGSYDPLLEWALRESRSALATFFDGSFDGLERFAHKEGLATGLHVYAAESAEWNVPVVRERFGDEPVVLVEWAWRERGLIVSSGLQDSISGMEDLKNVTVIPRPKVAGSQRLFDHMLSAHKIDRNKITFTAPSRSEGDAALAVLEGKADAAFGLACYARQYRLPFVPIIRERFDLLVDRRSWFDEPMQTLVEFCRKPEFAAKAEALGGYEISGFGKVHFNGA